MTIIMKGFHWCWTVMLKDFWFGIFSAIHNFLPPLLTHQGASAGGFPSMVWGARGTSYLQSLPGADGWPSPALLSRWKQGGPKPWIIEPAATSGWVMTEERQHRPWHHLLSACPLKQYWVIEVIFAFPNIKFKHHQLLTYFCWLSLLFIFFEHKTNDYFEVNQYCYHYNFNIATFVLLCTNLEKYMIHWWAQ